MTSKTRSALSTEQTTNFADNTTGAITPAILRSTVQDMIDSTGTLLDSNAWTGSAMSFTGSVTFTGNVAISGSSFSVSAISNFTASATFSLPILVDASITTGVAGSTAGQILIAGSTSGTTTIVSNAAAGGTQTLQNATDTFVYLATTDTLTNKTINAGSTGSNTLQISGVTTSRGQYPGTATNDSATAGNFGEEIESVLAQGSATSLVNGTPKTITSIAVTAGDWDISGNAQYLYGAANVVNGAFASLSTTANTNDTTNGRYAGLYVGGNAAPGAGVFAGIWVGPLRFSFSVSTTVNLIGQAYFTSTMSGFGIIRARRMR